MLCLYVPNKLCSIMSFTQFVHIAHRSQWMERIYHKNENIFRLQYENRNECNWVWCSKWESKRKNGSLILIWCVPNTQFKNLWNPFHSHGKWEESVKKLHKINLSSKCSLYFHTIYHSCTHIVPLAIAFISRQMI